MPETLNDHMAKQAYLSAQMKMPPPLSPKEVNGINEAHAAFKQARELCSYAESIVDRLVGGAEANDGYGEDTKLPYGVFPVLLSEAQSIQRRMNEAMNALRRLESQLP